MMLQFPKPDVEQYFQTTVIRQFAVSRDESRIVFSSNLNGHYNLWAIEMEGTAFPYPLTYINQVSSFIAIDPEQRHILCGFDRDGDENYHIYALPPAGGKPVPLFEADEKDKMYFAHLSEDGERLYYCTSRNNPNFLNSRVYNLRTKQDELLIEGQGAATDLEAVSPGEGRFVYGQSYSNTYRVLYVRTEEGDLPMVPAEEGEVHRSSRAIFVDEDTVVFATDYKAEYAYAASYHIPSRQFSELCRIPREGIVEIKWHKDSRTLYFVTEKGVEDRLYRFSLDARELEPMELPNSLVDQIHVAQSGTVYLLARGAASPANIYMQADRGWKQLTRNLPTGLTPEQMVEPEVVTYSSFDGMEIEALLFRAKAEAANGYTIFWPHGGPQAAERKQFRSMFQYFLAQGYHIFAPNFRGSTGYGSSFVKLVECDWGEGPRLDCVAGMDWLFEQGISSKERLFIVGGSYGGYMTLLLAGRHADYFRAAVDIFGVSNLFTFYHSVPEHWKPMMERWVGEPERDKERFIKDSPITYLEGMTNPMLVIQGANDPRVVKAESDQIVEQLRQQGRDVEYIVLDDEGHGFTKKENEMRVYRAIVDFLQRHHG